MTNNDELAYREKHSRLWERYDEAAHDNAEHMRNILQLTLAALEAAERHIFKAERDAKALLAERDADKKQLAEMNDTLERECEKSRRMASRIAELETVSAAAEKLVRCKGRYHSEQNYRALAALFGVSTPDLPPVETEVRELELIVPPRRCFDYAALAVQERDEQWHKALHDACKRAGIKLEVGE